MVGGGAYGYSHANDCNVYLIDGGNTMALIDSGGGKGAQKIIENIKSFGLDPKRIKFLINTHCHYDHIGGNKAVKDLTGCKIAAHESEVKIIENLDVLTLADRAKQRGINVESAKVDARLKEGDMLNIDKYELKVLHTPGHTPGSICLYVEEKGKRILFSGDIVSAQGRLGFINGPGFSLDDWKTSLKRLVDLKIDTMFPGHGTFVISEAYNHIKLYSDKMNVPWTNIVTDLG